MGRPAISVLMPIHNAERYLPEALSSLLAQTLQEWELIAVLDRSTDGSRSILTEVSDSRIRVFSAPAPGGMVGALNYGLALCKAAYVARFDADDVCKPRRFELQALRLARQPRLAALGSAAILIDEESCPIGIRRVVTGPEHVRRQLLWRNALIHSSVMFRRDLIVSLGGYEQTAKVQDYVLWLRVAARSDVDNLAEALLSYRIHKNQDSRGFRPHDISHNMLLSARVEASRRAGVTRLGAIVRHGVWTGAQYRHSMLHRD